MYLPVYLFTCIRDTLWDTQFPSYIVFDQSGEGKPRLLRRSCPTPPDPEMALLNARDVFARRDDHVPFVGRP
jgi:1,2-phenylacetyl-CoA epoxidase PaaB subunit